jgi:hypothetical protein
MAHFIICGSQRIIAGNNTHNNIANNCNRIYGVVLAIMSCILMSEGAMPLSTNKATPKGGVRKPIPMAIKPE